MRNNNLIDKECIMCGNRFSTYRRHRGHRGIMRRGNIRSSISITCSKDCTKRYVRICNNLYKKIKNNVLYDLKNGR